MDIIEQLSLALGASWASGINLYATIVVLGYMNLTGAVTLPESLQILSNPLVLGAAGLMYCVEFFADKIPGVDSGWDALHTFIRIPAGALLASNGMADLGVAAELAAALVGGGLAATTHATKAGSRIMINTSPEPFSNWSASVAEDVTVIGGLWAALHYPWLFLSGLVVFILLMIWFLPMLWRTIKILGAKLARLFGMKSSPGTNSG